MVHRAAGQQRADRDALGPDGPIGQDDQTVAIFDRSLGFHADPVQRANQRIGLVVRDIDRLGAPAAMIHVANRREFLIRQDRMRHEQPLRMPLRCLKQVPLRADVALQRHDDFFANRVDGRVRDLCEQLLEVVVNHAWLIGQTGERRVVAHGANRVAQFAYQRQQHELHRLGGVAQRLHPIQQRFGVEAMSLATGAEIRHGDPLLRQPLAVRRAIRKFVLQFLVRDQPPLLEIDQKHAARFEAPLLLDQSGVDTQHSDLAGHDHPIVVCQVITTRPQAVAVQHGADVTAVGESDRSRTVPWLHQARVVLVESAFVIRHQFLLLPRLRDHHHDRFLQRAAGHQQEFEHIVERAGVRRIGFDDREEPVDRPVEEIAADDALTRSHPVDVAAQRVDLAVVGHEPVRLCAIPARKRIRRETRVHHREVRLVIGIPQVWIERKNLIGCEHPLVNDDLGRQAANEEGFRLAQRLVVPQKVARALANQIQLALERVARQTVGGGDEKLLDVRTRRAGRRSDIRLVGIGRHHAPADQRLALLGTDLLDHGLALRALGGVGRQKDDAGGEPAGLRQLGAAVDARDFRQKLVGKRRQDAGAVTGVRLAAARATVLHAATDHVRIRHDLVTALALDMRNEADAARIALV